LAWKENKQLAPRKERQSTRADVGEERTEEQNGLAEMSNRQGLFVVT